MALTIWKLKTLFVITEAYIPRRCLIGHLGYLSSYELDCYDRDSQRQGEGGRAVHHPNFYRLSGAVGMGLFGDVVSPKERILARKETQLYGM